MGEDARWPRAVGDVWARCPSSQRCCRAQARIFCSSVFYILRDMEAVTVLSHYLFSFFLFVGVRERGMERERRERERVSTYGGFVGWTAH